MLIHGISGTVGAAGTSFVNQGTIRSDQTNHTITLDGDGWTSSGSLEALSGGDLLAQGSWSTSGTVTVDSGSDFTASGPYVQTGGQTDLAGGTLTTTGGVDLQGGRLAGVGTVSGDLTNGAEVAPGTSPGTLAVTGAYDQTAAGRLAVDLAGTLAGEFDVLDVGGLATLDGELAIAVDGAFSPTLGDSFQVLEYGSLAGQFANLTGATLAGGEMLDPTYGAGALVLTVVAGP